MNFDVVVALEDVRTLRPDHPEVYLVALRELGLPGDECLAFEDPAVGLV